MGGLPDGSTSGCSVEQKDLEVGARIVAVVEASGVLVEVALQPPPRDAVVVARDAVLDVA